MDWLHKVLTFLTNPLTLGLAGLIVVVSCQLLVVRRKERKVKGLLLSSTFTYSLLAIAWLWLWSTPLMTRWMGLPLESPYPPIAAESYPKADAICLLGGGMGVWEKGSAEMWLSADRVWHAAKLWKAGKAKVITITGGEVWNSTAPLLQDFGVPTNAVRCITGAKNTEDEARLIAGAMRKGVVNRGRCTAEDSSFGTERTSTERKSERKDAAYSPRLLEEELPAARVLVVTSAWHMRRAEWLFRKAGLGVIPAACDYEVSARHAGKAWGMEDLIPEAEVLYRNTYLWKEHFAYFCYRARECLIGTK